MDLVFQALLDAAHCVAAAEVIRAGEVYEGLVIQRGLELAPDLMRDRLPGFAERAPDSGETHQSFNGPGWISRTACGDEVAAGLALFAEGKASGSAE